MLSTILASALTLALTAAQTLSPTIDNLPDAMRQFPSCSNSALTSSMNQANCNTENINRDTFTCMCSFPNTSLDAESPLDVFKPDVLDAGCFQQWSSAWARACAYAVPELSSDEDVSEAAGVLRGIVGGGGDAASSTMMGTSTTSASSETSGASESTGLMQSTSQTAALTTAAGSPSANSAMGSPSSTSAGLGAAVATVGVVGPAIAALAMFV